MSEEKNGWEKEEEEEKKATSVEVKKEKRRESADKWSAARGRRSHVSHHSETAVQRGRSCSWPH